MATRWSISYDCKPSRKTCATFYPKVLQETYPHDAMLAAGAVIGALCAGKITYLIGHRYSIMVYDVFIFIACLMSVILGSKIKKTEMNVSSVLLGIGIGALCTALPSYIGEITTPTKRSKNCFPTIVHWTQGLQLKKICFSLRCILTFFSFFFFYERFC